MKIYIYVLFTALVAASMLLSACASADAPAATDAPAAAAAPAATDAPAAAAAPAATDAPAAAAAPAATDAPAATVVAAVPAAPIALSADLIAACKAEGKLTIIAIPANWANYGEIFTAFEAISGVKINSLNENAGFDDELKAIQTNKGSKGPQAPDVVDVSYTYGKLGIDAGDYQPYKISNWDKIPDTVLGIPAKDPNGMWTGGYYGVMAMEVNTAVVKNIPATWADLLKPEYKGQVALIGDPRTSNQAGQTVIAAALANGGSLDDIQPGLDFFKQLNTAGNFAPAIAKVATIAQGTTPITFAWDYNAFGDQASLAGKAPISVTYLTPSVASMYIQAISAYAPHPNCGKLWMEVLHSDVGQLAWIKGFAHGVQQADLEARGVIPADMMARLPSSSTFSSAVSPDPDQLSAAATAIQTGWNTTVGVNVR